jgi:hypothetical protein
MMGVFIRFYFAHKNFKKVNFRAWQTFLYCIYGTCGNSEMIKGIVSRD